MGNETEVDSAVNVTSLSTGDKEEKIEEVSQFTSLSSSSDPTRTGRKFRDEEVGSGMLEEVFQPTPGTPTSSEGATTTLASPEISSESAETENLLLHEPVSTSFVKEHVTPFMEEEEQESEEEVRQQVPTLPPWQDAKEDMETTVFDLDSETSPTTPSPTHPPSPSDVTVDFFDLGSRRTNLGPPSHSPHELQGRDPTSWSMPDNYDYMTPYDDSVSPTTEDYPYTSTTDSYDDDISTTLLPNASLLDCPPTLFSRSPKDPLWVQAPVLPLVWSIQLTAQNVGRVLSAPMAPASPHVTCSPTTAWTGASATLWKELKCSAGKRSEEPDYALWQ